MQSRVYFASSVLIALTTILLITLNYGFANLAVALGSNSLPLVHLVLGSALLGYFYSASEDVVHALKHPASILWLILLVLGIAHLAIDVPKYGLVALRDASFVIEGGMLVVGLVIAVRTKPNTLLRFIGYAFLLVFAYSLTYPARELIRDASPVSGVFQSVPVFGAYSQVAMMLTMGALFYLLVGDQAMNWPRKWTLTFAGLQGAWATVFQSRTVYLGILIACVMLLVLSGWKRAIRGFLLLVVSSFLLSGLLSYSPAPIRGRLATVDLRFTVMHWAGLVPRAELPRQFIKMLPSHPDYAREGDHESSGSQIAEGSTQWRIELWTESLRRWAKDRGRMIWGEGFGRPLTDIGLEPGVVVRQPHNIFVSVLMRLGAIGFIVWVVWDAFILLYVGLPLWRSRAGKEKQPLRLWFLLVMILGILVASTQPWLEFSYGAIPFFLTVGIGLGFLVGANPLREVQRVPQLDE